ncbi:alpha/beta fold hydrolase [Parafrankia elaeagni]|uniref:alpha/beta fold hydrolase n=1 Tax=Parafrankia elaeagni TaxID=222534 RepID=UPI00036B99EF|nr:alpha/beta fold hydrolase [Parafrankia elaeagni]
MADVLTHVTAPTRYLEVNGIRYAYRRFGAGEGTPLLFLQHFRGGLDHWDPAVTDGLAANREVILFNNAGVASSSGETPETFAAMADHAAGFVGALGLEQVDVLGLSMGGAVAQELALRHPRLVRRLVIAGFRPRAGEAEGTAPDMISTVNSYVLAQHIPAAQLVIYPDSGHGSIFQYPELFVSQATRFLDAEHPFG